MELKLEQEVALESEELRRDYKNFLNEIGLYFFILRIERNLKPTPVEKLLRITPGTILQIEHGKLNWNTDMLEDIWDYYCSVPVKMNVLSRFNAKNKNGPLADLIKMGLKRSKCIKI